MTNKLCIIWIMLIVVLVEITNDFTTTVAVFSSASSSIPCITQRIGQQRLPNRQQQHCQSRGGRNHFQPLLFVVQQQHDSLTKNNKNVIVRTTTVSATTTSFIETSSGISRKGTKRPSSKLKKMKSKVKKNMINKTKDSKETLYEADMNSIELCHDDHNKLNGIKFTIRGKPVPLSRHRTARGFVYNPSFDKQQEFRRATLDILHSSGINQFQNVTRNDLSLSTYRARQSKENGMLDKLRPEPVFSLPARLQMKLVFRMPRPLAHFVGSKRSPDRLRPNAPDMVESKKSADVDNLAKFVLDSLNCIMYDDDHQIFDLRIIKVLDNNVNCTGAIDILIQQDDLDEKENDNGVDHQTILLEPFYTFD